MADDADLSTRRPTKSICARADAHHSKANDGNLARNHPNEFHSCNLKVNKKRKKWWAVELKTSTKNPSVQIHARNCCNRGNMAGGQVDIYITDSWDPPFRGANAAKPCLSLRVLDNGTPSGICKGTGGFIFVTTPGAALQVRWHSLLTHLSLIAACPRILHIGTTCVNQCV
jgi:hypothetical protein